MDQITLPHLKWKSPRRVPPRLGYLLALTLATLARRGPTHCLVPPGEPVVLDPGRVFVAAAVMAHLHHEFGPDAYAGRKVLLEALSRLPPTDIGDWIDNHLDEIRRFEEKLSRLIGFYVMDA